MNDSVNKFLQQNAWSIIISIVGVSLAWATFNARITAVEVRAADINEKTTLLTTIVERIIVLEERERTIVNDVAEIKADLKEVKEAVGR